jgi:riboflavin synthase
MFTGIVSALGSISNLVQTSDSAVITISAPFCSELNPGDSVSVNGVCLTAINITDETFSADVMGQTLKMTTLGTLDVGAKVNLELAMKPNSRFGGHMVQGHVDAVGEIQARTAHADWEVFRISLPADISQYVVARGSITVEGTSLTVSGISKEWFEVSLIPTTLTHTNLGQKQIGDKVNLESDILARHVERLLQK